jgi:hypothetical protein
MQQADPLSIPCNMLGHIAAISMTFKDHPFEGGLVLTLRFVLMQAQRLSFYP